jgi:hypothetical protein
MVTETAPDQGPGPKKKTINRLKLLIIILIIAAPLGLLAVGIAYGEWGSEELQALLGYVPTGIQQGENLWQAPFPDYGFGDLDPTVAYWLSAIIGVIIIIVVIWGISKLLIRKGARKNGTT